MTIDAFFHRKYNRNSYNCAHFVCEVWESLTGESIAHKLAGLLQPAVSAQPAVQAREAWTETVRQVGNRYSLRLDQLAFFIATAGA